MNELTLRETVVLWQLVDGGKYEIRRILNAQTVPQENRLSALYKLEGLSAKLEARIEHLKATLPAGEL